MDFNKCLKEVTNLNEYIPFTRDVEIKFNNIKILFNMSTVLSLKKIRAIEIEYFNKYEESGAAIRIFELLLRFPPMKTWGLLGKELICLLQYWLEALRKHLILHNAHWWDFLKRILQFIKDIRLKDNSINNIILEETAECLLDIATSKVPDLLQRFEIVQTFNSCGADSSRKIRFALKEQFENYFIKLSAIMAKSGDFRVQYSMLETLLRWLLPRHEPSVRQEAAAKWFPPELYNSNTVTIFLERTWQNFTKDARDFLNAHNETADLVVSAKCKKLTVGKSVCISDINKKDCWIDVNSSTRCISIVLDARLSEEMGGDEQNCDVMLINEQNTRMMQLVKYSTQVVIIINVLDLLEVYPFSNVIQREVCDEIRIQVETSCLLRLNRVLRNVFGENYQAMFDVGNTNTTRSPEIRESCDIINNSEEDTRFSNPVEMRRRKHSGFIARPRNPRSWNSPSTVSTSSLAQLHEKLVALPRYTYDKEPVAVCALPQLSSVTEVSEPDENQVSSASVSTVRLRTYGVCQKRNKVPENNRSNDHDKSIASEKNTLSPVVNNDEHSVSCLLLATIGSADDSVINDTIERLPKDIPCNTDNIVDLLAQEALQGNNKFGNKNSQYNEDDQNNQHIVPVNNTNNSRCFKAIQSDVQSSEKKNILSNLTTIDESSNEVVDNTPISYVNIKRHLRPTEKAITKRNKELYVKIKEDGNAIGTYDVQAVEEFFSQHFRENTNGDLVTSPTLAKKINETSSDYSEEFDSMLPNEGTLIQNFNTDLCLLSDEDVVECLNAIVDKVCEDFDKCAAYLDQQKGHNFANISSKSKPVEKTGFENVNSRTNVNAHKMNTRNKTPTCKNQPSKTIKLKNRIILSLNKNITDLTIPEPQSVAKVSPIIEAKSANEDLVNEANLNASNILENNKTPVTCRKRKLYSPKDETIVNENPGIHVPETEGDDTPTHSQLKTRTRTPISIATCYKELEKERKKRIRKPRTRKFTVNKPSTTSAVSPRTKKMNEIFDGLKDVVSTEKVILVDKDCPDKDIAVFNFTSESEDDDSRNAKVSSNKRKSTNAERSTESNLKRLRQRNVKTEKAKEPTVKITNRSVKRNQPKQNVGRKQTKAKTLKETKMQLRSNLEDERVRADNVPEKLNTSEVIECEVTERVSTSKEPSPVLKEIPQMEYIVDNNNKRDENVQNKKQNSQKVLSKKLLSLKKPLNTPDTVCVDLIDNKNEESLSPLPGLVVETILVTQPDINDSVTTNMFQKFKDIYQNKQAPLNSELNTTQNLLSDGDPVNGTAHLNVTEELQGDKTQPVNNYKSIAKIEKENKNVKKTQPVKQQRKKENSKRNKESKVTRKSEIVCLSSDNATIATLGNSRSPITGHGDFNEVPPNPTLLEEDIEPRNLDTEYLSESLKGFFDKLTRELDRSPEKQLDNKTKSPKKPNTSKSSSCVTKKSTVALKKLSLEDISRWLPSRRDSTTSTSERTKAESIKAADTNKHTEGDKSETRSNINQKVAGVLPALANRKTMISPIRFNDVLYAVEQTKPGTPHSDEDCVKRIRRILSTKPSAVKSDSTSDAPKKVSKPSPKPKQKSAAPSNPSSSEALFVKERFWAQQTNSQESSSAVKRKSSPLLPSPKKSKLNVSKNAESTIAHSLSRSRSVDDWLGHVVPTPTDHSLILSMKENNIQNVLEKLDTTLVEIHHNTSKRFINMFVETQKELNTLKEERRKMYQQTASEIIIATLKIVDDKFADLDRRSQSLDDEFLESMKKRSHDIIKEDCKQKQLMVTLLKEDTQAVIDFMNKDKN